MLNVTAVFFKINHKQDSELALESLFIFIYKPWQWFYMLYIVCTNAIEIRIQNAYKIFYLNNISYFKCSNTYLKYNFTSIKSIYFNLIYFNVAVLLINLRF